MNPKKKRTTRLALIAVFCAAFVAMGVLWFGSAGIALAEDPTPLSGSVKTASPEAVSPGSKVAYAIVLSNSSMISATGQVVVGDMLDPALSYVADSARVYPGGLALWSTNNLPYITFTVPSIAINSVITLAFQAEVSTAAQMGDVISNTALIHYNGSILERTALIEVAATPISKIMSPWDKQFITERGDFVISGRAWTADQTPNFPGVPVIKSAIYDPFSGGGANVVQWDAVSGVILSYVLQESPDDTFSTVDEVTVGPTILSWPFTGNTPGTYYYRIKTHNAWGDSFWSDVASVVVPTGNQAVNFAGLLSPTAPVFSYQPVVEIKIQKVGGVDTDWLPVSSNSLVYPGDWWDWTYTWSLPTENDGQQYVVQTRAKDLAGNYDPAKVETVTVTVKNGLRFMYFPLVIRYYPPIPYAPTLNIASNDGKGNYSLSWVYNYSNFYPTSYHFQEATDANFTNLTIDNTRTSPQTFTNQIPGTYYYRVQGINAFGAGSWSNTQVISVIKPGFFDDFSNSNSGWTKKTFDNTLETAYESGFYKMKILLNGTGGNNFRMGLIPAPYHNTSQKYDLEVDHRFVKANDQVVDPTAGKAGLIFGATADYSTVYMIEWNFEGQCSVAKYWSVGVPYVALNLSNVTYYKFWGSCGGTIHTGYNTTNNHIKVEVNGNTARVLMNGGEVVSFSTTEFGSSHDVGLMTASWQRTPVKSLFDNFRVTIK